MFDFVKIIPIEDTFFFRDKIPENIKLSSELVRINYLDKSPFKSGDLIFFQKDNNLYIWFVKYKLDHKKINIPESFLLVKNNPLESGFLIVRKKNSFSILVIKNGDIVSQVIYKKEPAQLEQRLKLLAKEYSILNPEIKEIQEIDIKKYDLKDLYLFSNFDISKEKVFKIILDNISIPLSIIFLGLSLYKLLDYKYLEKKESKLQEVYISLKKENKEIKEKIRQVQEKGKFWVNFVESELKYPLVVDILYNVTKIINSYNGFITTFSYTPELISMTIGLPKNRKDFIDKIIKTGLFKDIKILNTAPDRWSKDFEILDVELYPRERISNEKK